MILLLGDSEESLYSEFIKRGYSVKRTEDLLSVKKVEDFEAQYVISYNYRHILKPEIINKMKSSIINLHISYLPFNRGADPNIWSFLEDTPKGVSIHYIDEGIDTGPVLAQELVEVSETESLANSYKILHDEIQKLFWKIWPRIESGEIEPRPQAGEGSIHYLKDRPCFEEGLREQGWATTAHDLKAWYEVHQK